MVPVPASEIENVVRLTEKVIASHEATMTGLLSAVREMHADASLSLEACRKSCRGDNESLAFMQGITEGLAMVESLIETAGGRKGESK
jgi:hypothetical protein